LASYDSKTALKHSLKDLLEPLGNSLRKQPVKNQLLTIIEEARLFETLNSHPQGPQYRANLIKLIGLAEEFEALQPETLNAMGIAGKNASTFPVWLNENKDSIDEQPTADPQAEDAVVLKTWHSSKGLEWPVVMVLDAEKASEPRFPSISMAYPDGGMDAMLKDSFVRILPKFDDKKTKEKFAGPLAIEQAETNKNLYYVSLTRAREQLILPCWEDFSHGSMLSYLEPLTKNWIENQKVAFIEANKVMLSSAEQEKAGSPACQRPGIIIGANRQPEKLKHTISPSLEKENAEVELAETESAEYRPLLDLDRLKHLSANNLGTWVHLLYQIYFMQPKFLERAIGLGTSRQENTICPESVRAHLDGFRALLERMYPSITTFHAEVPIVGLNKNSQVVSGVVDLLIETEHGVWVIDHKSDLIADGQLYWRQLQYYSDLVGPEIQGVALNWVRSAVFESQKWPPRTVT